MVFLVVMYGCESWTMKKAEHQRIDAFELWCWRRLLRVLWTARRSNQSILKEINLNIHWKDWISNTLATDMKSWLNGKDPGAGKDRAGGGATENEMVRWHHQLDGHEFEQASGDSEGQASLAAAVHGVTKSRTWLSDWTTTICHLLLILWASQVAQW